MKGLLKFLVVLVIIAVVLYLFSGFILIKAKDYAITMTDKDRSAKILYVLGEAAETLKKYEAATEIYKDLVAMKPMATIASEAQYRLARCYEMLGRRSQAGREYHLFIKNFPNDRLVPEAQKRVAGIMEKGRGAVTP